MGRGQLTVDTAVYKLQCDIFRPILALDTYLNSVL